MDLFNITFFIFTVYSMIAITQLLINYYKNKSCEKDISMSKHITEKELEKKADKYLNKETIAEELLERTTFSLTKEDAELLISAMKQFYIDGAKENGVIWHNLKENPNDLPKCKEDKQLLFYVKEWYEDIQEYRNHWCLGFYKRCFMNNDIKLFVEKSKGYESEHLPKSVMIWSELPIIVKNKNDVEE